MSEGIAAGPPPSRSDAARSSDGASCPHCGARRITLGAVPCWMCGEMLPAHEGPLPRGTRLESGPDAGLISVAVLTILVVLGLTAEAPGLGIALAILATPALVRVVAKSHETKESGQPLTGAEKIGLFFSSLGTVILVGIAAFVAFFATCFAVCLGVFSVQPHGGDGSLMFLSVGAGLLVGIPIFIFLLRKAWKRKEP